MTDNMPTRRENFQSIAEKFATAPTGTDHNGRTDLDREQDMATVAGITGALDVLSDAAPALPAGPAPALRPNPAQGSSSATPATATGSGDTLRDRLRANAQQALDG